MDTILWKVHAFCTSSTRGFCMQIGLSTPHKFGCVSGKVLWVYYVFKLVLSARCRLYRGGNINKFHLICYHSWRKWNYIECFFFCCGRTYHNVRDYVQSLMQDLPEVNNIISQTACTVSHVRLNKILHKLLPANLNHIIRG